MTTAILYTPLVDSEIEELAAVLHNEAVYKFIGGMPSKGDFALGLRRALEGPPAQALGEEWINYVARLADTGELIGRVEATVHDDLAEIAFLYSPGLWGRGYASGGVSWLHNHLLSYKNVSSLWATTDPANTRSAALLRRCGYLQVSAQGLPVLYSYDEGDLVFRRSVA